MKQYKWLFPFPEEKTIQSALKEKPQDVSADNPYAYYVGKHGQYEATLTDCTCRDFIINRKQVTACKHITRLAMALGMIDENGAFTQAADLSAIEEEVKRVEAEQLAADKRALALAFGLYHLFGTSDMTDAEYDALKKSVSDRM